MPSWNKNRSTNDEESSNYRNYDFGIIKRKQFLKYLRTVIFPNRALHQEILQDETYVYLVLINNLHPKKPDLKCYNLRGIEILVDEKGSSRGKAIIWYRNQICASNAAKILNETTLRGMHLFAKYYCLNTISLKYTSDYNYKRPNFSSLKIKRNSIIDVELLKRFIETENDDSRDWTWIT
ncbi:hypothetical protein RF11_11724 [Thelohanellus kitauei]|uniref:RRM domain-containing protein n=1 Tax=Thelohanellus kitauei TaxID=669202 RepID=A0A0C2NCC7_THEKT|nr:hypothetical protein RF11_11724 [Thelohanellus kitauei]